MTSSVKEHWDKKYNYVPITQLGWYESKSFPSIQLIEQCAIPKDYPIVDIGFGTSILSSNLLELGCDNLRAINISDIALEKAKALLNKEQAAQDHWLVDDITNPSNVLRLENVAVWHDRAVFHFLTEEQHRQTYHSLLHKIDMPGGFIIMATFAVEGATKCSGLSVQRYAVEGLCKFFGDGFRLIERLDYIYRWYPGHVRHYVYARYQ